MIRITPHTHKTDNNTAFRVTFSFQHKEKAARLNKIQDVLTRLDTIPAGSRVTAMKKNSPFMKVTTAYRKVIPIYHSGLLASSR